MQMTKYNCPSCAKRLVVTTSAGATIRCPQCKTNLLVSAAGLSVKNNAASTMPEIAVQPKAVSKAAQVEGEESRPAPVKRQPPPNLLQPQGKRHQATDDALKPKTVLWVAGIGSAGIAVVALVGFLIVSPPFARRLNDDEPRESGSVSASGEEEVPASEGATYTVEKPSLQAAEDAAQRRAEKQHAERDENAVNAQRGREEAQRRAEEREQEIELAKQEAARTRQNRGSPTGTGITLPVGRGSKDVPDDPIKAALQSVAIVSLPSGHGSGFIAAPQTLVTNAHVIASGRVRDIKVRFPDNDRLRERSFPVDLVAEDPVHDLAVLRVDCDVPPLSLDGSFKHSNGQRVVAIGSPGTGGPGGEMLANLSTDGRLGPEYRQPDGSLRWAMAMPINAGNSGGPILHANTGQVIGVVVAKFLRTESQSLAVPMTQVVGALKASQDANASDIRRTLAMHRSRFCVAHMAKILHLAHLSFTKSCEAADSAEHQTDAGKLEAFNDFKSEASKILSDEFVMFETTVSAEVDELRQDTACDPSTRIAIQKLHSTVADQVQNLRKSVAIREIDHFLREFRESLVRANALTDSVAKSIAFEVEDVRR